MNTLIILIVIWSGGITMTNTKIYIQTSMTECEIKRAEFATLDKYKFGVCKTINLEKDKP